MTQLQRLRLMQQVSELLWMLLGPATLTSFPSKALLMRPATLCADKAIQALLTCEDSHTTMLPCIVAFGLFRLFGDKKQ